MRQKILYILLMITTALSWSLKAGGQTYANGTWYSFYWNSSKDWVNNGDFVNSEIFAPTNKTISFEYKKYSGLSTTGSLSIYETAENGNETKTGSQGSIKSTNYNTYNGTCSENFKKIRVYKDGGTGVTVRNVFIPLGKHILLDNNSTYGTKSMSVTPFDNEKTKVGKQNTQKYTIKLRSFLTAEDITITSSSNAFHFGNGLTAKSFTVGANACASVNGSGNCSTGVLGNIDNYSVDVCFTPTQAGENSGTITITDGTSSVTVSISAIGYIDYSFSAEAGINNERFGSSTIRFDQEKNSPINIQNSTNNSETKIASFSATSNTGYEFVGWGTTTDATSYESTANPYNYTMTATLSAPSQSKTLYAIFKPVFNFSASATSSNETLGTATASVNDAKILGDVDDTQAQTTATFTAIPADDCVFKGWYEASDYTGEPISTNTTYDVTLTNSETGSTATKTLYALFKKKQNLQWADADLDLNLVNGQNYSSAATVTSGKTISYTTDNAQAVTIDADGTIHAVGLGDAHVTASVEGNDIYQPETITRDFSVGEIKQATFTPAWGEGTSTDIKVDGSTSIGLLNIANDATFTIAVGTPGIINVNRDGNTLNIAALIAGTTTLTLTQTGNASLAGNQVTYTITVSKYPNTLALADETKAMKVDEVWENVVTTVGNNNTTVSYSVDGVATYDPATNKITALAEGSTVITFEQEATATHEGTSKTVNVTVTKVVNTLSVTLGNTEVDVDGTINLIVAGRVSDGATHAYISDVQLSSEINNGTDVITYAHDVITACNAGTAKIMFTQDATNKYTSYESETYTITVNKLSNAVTVTLDGEQKNSKNVGRGATVTMGLASTSGSSDFQFSRVSGTDDIATISSTSIVSGQTDGTSIWEISQAETYKYVAATTTVRVKVNSEPEEEGYVLNEEREYSQGTGEGVTHTYTLSGPGETLTYSARTQSAAIYYHLYVQYSTDGSNWINAQDNQQLGSSYQNYSCDIPEEAKYVRFYFPAGGTLTKYVKNVKVTRKTYVRATATQTNLGEVYTDKTAATTFNVSYSSTNGGDIEILSNNPRFTVDKAAIRVDNHTDNVSDPVVVTVTYTPDPNHLGDDEGTITISDRYYSAELTFTAFAKKYPTTISRGSNTATETTVDGTIDNAFAFTGTSATVPTANSDDDFYYTIANSYTSDVHTEDGVITYDPATNTITGRNAGTARLTIYQKSTALYAATSQTFEFTVSKLANPVNIALSSTSIDVDGTANVALTNDDGKGAVSVAYSNIAYTNEALNREGDLLSYNEETKTLTGVNAGTATLTVIQAETYKYLAKSQQFNVAVNKLTQTLTWDHEVETAVQVGTVIINNTATSAEELAPVTYTSSNTAAIEVDSESGRLTAKAVGANITITATQTGNYKYTPATVTRQFSVFNKQTPTFIPDEAHYDSEAKTITVDWEGTATITVTGVGDGAEAGFTITNGNDAVINVVRDEATITISGLTIGSTTLTLAQAANDDYLAKTETYTINVVMPTDYLTLDPAVAPTIAEGTYRKVTLNRTLKAGYSTIALPFEVDATTLSANAWVAQLSIVTYNAHDGYSLYFKKSNVIKANEPYILHLDAEVVSPVFRGTIAVSEATPKDNTADKGIDTDDHSYADWQMVSNYTPDFDMEGKYGVVNADGCLKQGGQGATLNAFTAYLTYGSTPNAAKPRVKAAFVNGEEADGLLELLQGPGQAMAEEVYDLQGRRLSAPQRGINLIRQSNGRVKKVTH